MTREELRAELTPLLVELRLLRQALLPSDEAVQGGCSHPDAARVNLTAASGPEEWICRDCGHHHVAER